MILDCCFSGDMANVPGLQADGVAEEFRKGLAVIGENVTLLSADCTTIQADEIWSFCYSNQNDVPDAHVGTYGHDDV